METQEFNGKCCIISLPFLSEVALSTSISCFECVRQLPNISMCLPHHRALVNTPPQLVERISEKWGNKSIKKKTEKEKRTIREIYKQMASKNFGNCVILCIHNFL